MGAPSPVLFAAEQDLRCGWTTGCVSVARGTLGAAPFWRLLWTLVSEFLCGHRPPPLGRTPASGRCRAPDICWLLVLKKLPGVGQGAVPSYAPASHTEGPSFSTSWPAFGVVAVSYFSHSERCAGTARGSVCVSRRLMMLNVWLLRHPHALQGGKSPVSPVHCPIGLFVSHCRALTSLKDLFY